MDHLFVHPKSSTPLSGGRLSYWLATAIKVLDPTGSGRAHDVRKVSHSLAFARGVPPEEILHNGFWVSPNVFISKYLMKTDPLKTALIGGRHFITPSGPKE